MGGNVLIEGHRGHFLEDRHGVVGVHADKFTFQKWTLERQHSGEVLIKSHLGKYLEDRNGKVGLHKDRALYQQWRLEDAGNGKVLIKSHRGQYLEDRAGKVGLRNDKRSFQHWTLTRNGRNVCTSGAVGRRLDWQGDDIDEDIDEDYMTADSDDIDEDIDQDYMTVDEDYMTVDEDGMMAVDPEDSSNPSCLHVDYAELEMELGLDSSGPTLSEMIASEDVILDNPEDMEDTSRTLADLSDCDYEERLAVREGDTEEIPAPEKLVEDVEDMFN